MNKEWNYTHTIRCTLLQTNFPRHTQRHIHHKKHTHDTETQTETQASLMSRTQTDLEKHLYKEIRDTEMKDKQRQTGIQKLTKTNTQENIQSEK